MQRLLLTLSLMLLAGCNGIEFKTNAGPYISGRVKSALIEEYSLAEIHQSNGTLLGSVSANSCQTLLTDDKPRPESIKKSLKIKTHDMGGNAIVFEGCYRKDSASCLEFIECKGLAYIIPKHNEQEPNNPPNTPNRAF
ncbi:hypothetical protein [Microbulbifer sp. TRSA007]|uniref:hypothetical protein n=1 Tax=unclassified Microbulbifer TaxID=2619833 RepID=UPI004039437B